MTSLASIEKIFSLWSVGLPESAFWLAPVTLLLLAATALIDAKTGRIPDTLILAGVLIATLTDGLLVDWPFAAQRLAIGLAAAMGLALANHFWRRLFGHDALGMGDAKWTALAAMVFPGLPVVIAWIVGSWIGVLWIAGAGLLRLKINRVHFAPFLFLGLVVGLLSRACPSWLSAFSAALCF